eukprot:gnl/MRDRNA2_/MRDRNA2_89004_c0_seq1.p1 gnl/MRDRNA2_/MRDRNA2_89004_c0~~gnl/MRDRNA2_/MRDRNA2_89004_c0_seq1.p1  ORF type:complete len:263 (+),score=45.85 gnl/MRDRNA2_/MRDRNA2_89004_c0_seq1:55-789(+)
MAAIANGYTRVHKRSSSTTNVRRSANSQKVATDLPAIHDSKKLSLRAALAARSSAPKQFGGKNVDALKKAFAECEDIEMDAEIQANHMLKYQELKFKSNYPKLSEVLQDAENRMPSKLRKGYVFSGLQELREAAHGKVQEAELVDVAQLFSMNKEKTLGSHGTNGLRRSESQPPQRAVPDSEQTNYLMFRKRFDPRRERVADGGISKQAHQWQKDLRPDVVVPPRLPLPCNCNFQLHLASSQQY